MIVNKESKDRGLGQRRKPFHCCVLQRKYIDLHAGKIYVFIYIFTFKIFLFVVVTELVTASMCRFCDLVFQGPLSVQEDWIKHLQRHIMNTAVPRTGAGMVEVTTVPTDSCSNTEPQAQPSVMQTSS